MTIIKDCLNLIGHIQRCYNKGLTVQEQLLLQKSWLFDRYSLCADRFTLIRNRLFKTGLLRATDSGHFILGRDLHHYSSWDLTRLLDYSINTGRHTDEALLKWFQLAIECIETARQHYRDNFDIPQIALFSTAAKDKATA
jgi:hypothetical protein